ncbi:hypothetical protein JVT61DRAFT_8490 [Boletus reticuloceps]|uniref:WW domain-containing protein n=1 Tax=Boletus reticuloceps TaxID=495285 RepID=A0A8I3AFF5_9AGAM|nr:hypothetical protein JVT61DRAFT_8490 [Boletus reticuloceps]
MSSPSPASSGDSKETGDKPQSSPEPEQEPKESVKKPLSTTIPLPPSASLSVGAWQAIFSSQHNAYYFYNTSTAETTWVNPIQSSPSDPSSSTCAQDTAADPQASGPDGNVNPNPYDPNSIEARAIAAGIDPSLAHLDPSLAGPSSLAHAGSFTAKFNARTGAFTAADARAPSHLSEYERMKRMSEFYFDVGSGKKMWNAGMQRRYRREARRGSGRRRRTW